MGQMNPMSAILYRPADFWPSWQRLRRPRYRNRSIYWQDGMLDSLTLPWSNRWRCRWLAYTSRDCICFSHSSQPVNQISSQSLVLCGGGRVAYSLIIPLFPIQTPSENRTFCLKISMSANVVRWTNLSTLHDDFSIDVWSTCCNVDWRFPSSVYFAVLQSFWHLLPWLPWVLALKPFPPNHLFSS